MINYSCIRCKRFVEDLYLCEDCYNELLSELKLNVEVLDGHYVYRMFNYDRIIKELIHMMKFKRQRHISKFFSKLMHKSLIASDIHFDFISEIPMHRYKKMVRGYDQARDLALELSKISKKEYITTLKRNRWTKSLYKLGKKDRNSELKNLFNVLDYRENLLIVDDILTTGSTISQAIIVLEEYGENFSFITLV